MTRLIFCDLDSTLLPAGRDRLSAEILEHITRLTNKGVQLCIASGRPYSQLKALLGPLYRRVYFICHDGALIMHRDCVLYKRPLQKPEALLGGCEATLFTRAGETALSAADRPLESINRAGGEILKIALPERRTALGARSCYQNGGIYEYVNTDADKGAAAKALCEKLRISPERCAALGDGENDIPLLKFIPRAFRMPQSHPLLCDMGLPVKTAEEFLKDI